jgi:hypothetical protein
MLVSRFALVATLCAAGLSSAQAACYDWPFDNPVFGDPWGSTEGRDHPHYGLDFPMASGTTIQTISNGSVVLNGWSSCLGWYIVIGHDDGWYSGYGHMLEESPLSVGTSVVIGNSIGKVGNTGSCSQGSHLHLTIGDHSGSYGDGDTVDPYDFITGHGATNESCNAQDDDCDGDEDEGNTCEALIVEQQVVGYAPPTTTDVNGDGNVDICAFEKDGLRCWPSNGTGWDAAWPAVPWSEEGEWATASHYATVRMGDLNGDGNADVCARSSTGILCALSTGSTFSAPRLWLGALGDSEGWTEASLYSTLRLADVTGDGRDDLCARTAAGLTCWASTGSSFESQINGPAWSDASGYNALPYYGTLRMGDLDGDHRADACIRNSVGVDCWLSDGASFSTQRTGPAWKDSSGWDAVRFWSTMRMADINGDGRQDI